MCRMFDTGASAAQNLASFHAPLPRLQGLVFGWRNLGTIFPLTGPALAKWQHATKAILAPLPMEEGAGRCAGFNRFSATFPKGQWTTLRIFGT